MGILKTVPVDLKKISDAVDNEVVKNTKFNILKTKVNNLNNKVPDATTLIHINQYDTDKQNLKKKTLDVDKRYIRYRWFSDYNCFEYKFIYLPTLDALEIQKDKGTNYVLSWKLKGIFNSELNPLYTAFLNSIKLSENRIRIKFDKDPFTVE